MGVHRPPTVLTGRGAGGRRRYAHKDLGVFSDSYSQFVDIDGVAMLRLSPAH